jgi:hypothetical protein
MPRFHFDLLGACAVHDQQGMPFEDCEVAARFAERMATDLGASAEKLPWLLQTNTATTSRIALPLENNPPPRQLVHGRTARVVCLMLEGPSGSGFP